MAFELSPHIDIFAVNPCMETRHSRSEAFHPKCVFGVDAANLLLLPQLEQSAGQFELHYGMRANPITSMVLSHTPNHPPPPLFSTTAVLMPFYSLQASQTAPSSSPLGPAPMAPLGRPLPPLHRWSSPPSPPAPDHPAM